jgi:NAD(P)-dependent dehydrogenase (short-subunit alcohol dehydrogenase family)
MSIVPITGANKGLGRDAARRLIADGRDVWMAARDVDRGREAAVAEGVRMTHAFLPLLERSDNPVIVNPSSGMGSLHLTSDPGRLESTIIVATIGADGPTGTFTSRDGTVPW